MQVDLFVNYDCDLQAANLFERTTRALCRTVRAAPAHPSPAALTLPAPPPVAALAAPGAATLDGGGGSGSGHALRTRAATDAPSARAERSKAAPSAVAVLLALLQSLNRWAQPLLEAAEAACTEGESDVRLRAPRLPGIALPATVLEAAALEPSSSSEAGDRVPGLGLGLGARSGPRLELGRAGSGGAGEVARFGAAKERKHSLENGVAVFNRDGHKGVAALIASGTVAPDARAVAAFLRGHCAALDKVWPCYYCMRWSLVDTSYC